MTLLLIALGGRFGVKPLEHQLHAENGSFKWIGLMTVGSEFVRVAPSGAGVHVMVKERVSTKARLVVVSFMYLVGCSHLEENPGGYDVHNNQIIARPDLSGRPLQVTAEREIDASPQEVFDAWTTEKFAKWFADPDAVIIKPEVNAPYFFESRFEGQRHPHYGRFLRLERGKLIELTWLTEAGTKGAETVVTVELIPVGSKTKVKLSHIGFVDEESRRAHEEAWPYALEQLDKKIR